MACKDHGVSRPVPRRDPWACQPQRPPSLSHPRAFPNRCPLARSARALCLNALTPSSAGQGPAPQPRLPPRSGLPQGSRRPPAASARGPRRRSDASRKAGTWAPKGACRSGTCRGRPAEDRIASCDQSLSAPLGALPCGAHACLRPACGPACGDGDLLHRAVELCANEVPTPAGLTGAPS